jgi:hypothetical protein
MTPRADAAAGALRIASVARIADFDARPPTADPLPREAWREGDFVIAEVVEGGATPFQIESPSGRLVEVAIGDLLLGALGRRAATLGVVGDWRGIASSRMQTLNVAGVIGRVSSTAYPRPAIAELEYVGHAHRDGQRLAMGDFAVPDTGRELEAPVVLIIGTSMQAGKTAAGKAIVRRLKRMGLRVAATKLTGVGRYRDVQAMGDAGADVIADFVDVGLPSTAVAPEDFERATRALLSLIAERGPDVVVAEAGASPLEPYNGDLAVRMLGERVRCTVLCASDPYAVLGVMEAFGVRPDLVSGPATGNEAALALVDRLTGGLPARNLIEDPTGEGLADLLAERIGAAPARLGGRASDG